MEFYIPDTGKTVKAKHRPIVIITSNAEKELPDAFLRRCIFHYIAFPEQPMMEKIIKAHYPDLDQTLIDGVLDLSLIHIYRWMRHPPANRRHWTRR